MIAAQGAGAAGASRRRSRRCSARRPSLLPAMNGVPWWFLPAAAPRRAAARRASTPAARCSRALPLARVARLRRPPDAARARRPGMVRHGFGERLIVGEPAGGAVGARRRGLRARSPSAGFEAEASADIRREVWYKLWGNMTMNPVSALTGAGRDRDPRRPAGARLHAAHAWPRRRRSARASAARSRSPARSAWTWRASSAASRPRCCRTPIAGRPIELDALVTRGARDRRARRRADAEHRRPARPDAADGAAARPLPADAAVGVAPARRPRRRAGASPVLSRARAHALRFEGRWKFCSSTCPAARRPGSRPRKPP